MMSPHVKVVSDAEYSSTLLPSIRRPGPSSSLLLSTPAAYHHRGVGEGRDERGVITRGGDLGAGGGLGGAGGGGGIAGEEEGRGSRSRPIRRRNHACRRRWRVHNGGGWRWWTPPPCRPPELQQGTPRQLPSSYYDGRHRNPLLKMGPAAAASAPSGGCPPATKTGGSAISCR
jgi:hypothetical protein